MEDRLRPEKAGRARERARERAEGGVDDDLSRLGARIAELRDRCLGAAVPGRDGLVGHPVPADEGVSQPPRRDGARLLTLFVVTRVTLTVIGLVSRELVPGPVLRPRPVGVGATFSSFSFLDVWGEWDSSWYLSIARDGYRAVPIEGTGANYGFFPLYPLLSRWVGAAFGSPFIGGLIVSNAALLVACAVLYRLVALDDDEETARRAVKYLFAAPAAFMFSAMLTESLYLALVVMCFYFGRIERWETVGVLGFLLALSRGPGVFAAVPLLWMYLEQRGFSLRRVRPDVLWLALLPAGVGIFMWFNWQLTGDSLSFTHIQASAWGHRLQNPVSAVWRAVSADDVFTRFNGWYMLGVIALIVAFRRRFGTAYALFAVISVLTLLTFGVPWNSMIRYTVVIFPLYVAAARFTRGRPGLDQALLIASALLQGLLMSLWANNSLLVI